MVTNGEEREKMWPNDGTGEYEVDQLGTRISAQSTTSELLCESPHLRCQADGCQGRAGP